MISDNYILSEMINTKLDYQTLAFTCGILFCYTKVTAVFSIPVVYQYIYFIRLFINELYFIGNILAHMDHLINEVGIYERE